MAAFAEPILHVDMDAFFVEVERLDDRSLVGRPVMVGGLGPRGVVASASYEARGRGVRSAMPMGEARRRAPMAVAVAPRHARYREVSARVFEVLSGFTPVIETLSIDEAFLDVSGLWRHYPSVEFVGVAIRAAVSSDIGIPASVGIATSKFLAKLASAKAKPDGLLRVRAGEQDDFLLPLSIDDLWGVGAATKASLESLGIRTIGDVAAAPDGMLRARLGPSQAEHLSALARGDDPRTVTTESSARSISVEETFAADLTNQEDIEGELLRLCDRLAGRLARAHLAGRTITLKVRFGDFTTVTRSATASDPIALRPDLWQSAKTLLGRVRGVGRPVRLIGVGVSGLVADDQPSQLRLAGDRRSTAAEAAEAVRARFGDGAVIPARLAENLPDGE